MKTTPLIDRQSVRAVRTSSRAAQLVTSREPRIIRHRYQTVITVAVEQHRRKTALTETTHSADRYKTVLTVGVGGPPLRNGDNGDRRAVGPLANGANGGQRRNAVSKR